MRIPLSRAHLTDETKSAAPGAIAPERTGADLPRARRRPGKAA